MRGAGHRMVTEDREAQIVDLRSVRIGRLSDALEPTLEAGHVVASTSNVDSVPEWRQAARNASSRRGWRVCTGAAADGSRVWAARIDRELPSDDDALAERLQYLHALTQPR